MMMFILFHLQTNIAHRDLLTVFMLKEEHAIGDL